MGSVGDVAAVIAASASTAALATSIYVVRLQSRYQDELTRTTWIRAELGDDLVTVYAWLVSERIKFEPPVYIPGVPESEERISVWNEQMKRLNSLELQAPRSLAEAVTKLRRHLIAYFAAIHDPPIDPTAIPKLADIQARGEVAYKGIESSVDEFKEAARSVLAVERD